MLYYTDNPVADAERYYNDKEEELNKLPECDECGHPIQGEYCYEINHKYICAPCLVDNHRKAVEDICGG